MNYENSCGAVVFTRHNGKIQYVIIQSLEGYYGFPKGHMEGIEEEEETALREIYEETGLRVRILDEFKTSDEHPIPNKEGVIKRIIYFLAEYEDQEIQFQKEELLGASLMNYEEALSAFQFDSSKRILTEANSYLCKLYNMF
jgi:bis(5'-nucleosidyl)-tetraphosphatase